MTRTPVGLLMLALLGALGLNATTVNCSLTGGSNTVTSVSNGGTPTFSGTYTCTLPTISGYTLTSLDLIINDDYSLGTSDSNNKVQFTYSISSGLNGATALTTYVEGLAATAPFGVSSTMGGIVSQSGTPTCSLDATNAFDCE